MSAARAEVVDEDHKDTDPLQLVDLTDLDQPESLLTPEICVSREELEGLKPQEKELLLAVDGLKAWYFKRMDILRSGFQRQPGLSTVARNDRFRVSMHRLSKLISFEVHGIKRGTTYYLHPFHIEGLEANDLVDNTKADPELGPIVVEDNPEDEFEDISTLELSDLLEMAELSPVQGLQEMETDYVYSLFPDLWDNASAVESEDEVKTEAEVETIKSNPDIQPELPFDQITISSSDVEALPPSTKELFFVIKGMVDAGIRRVRTREIFEAGFRSGASESAKRTVFKDGMAKLKPLLGISHEGPSKSGVYFLFPIVVEEDSRIDIAQQQKEWLEDFGQKNNRWLNTTDIVIAGFPLRHDRNLEDKIQLEQAMREALGVISGLGWVNNGSHGRYMRYHPPLAEGDTLVVGTPASSKSPATLESRPQLTSSQGLPAKADGAENKLPDKKADFNQLQITWLREHGRLNERWQTVTEIVRAGFPVGSPKTESGQDERESLSLRETMIELGWVSRQTDDQKTQYHPPATQGEPLFGGEPILPNTPSAPVSNNSPTPRGSGGSSGGGSSKVSVLDRREEEDLVRTYLSDIGQHALLTKSDEVRLAKEIEAGVAAVAELETSGHDMTATKRRELRSISRKGEDAKRAFIDANYRLVVSIAKKYQASGLPLLDLIQEGNLGMMHAVEKFDWRKGFKFSTYATWWIRQAITRGIANTGRTIRLPVHAGDTLARLQKARSRLELKNGRPATLAELAREVEMPEDKVTEALRFAAEPLSLSTRVRDDGDAELGDFVEDTTFDRPDVVAATSLLPDEIDRMLAHLDEREREVVRLRFGLDRGEPRTLEEVGEIFNLTRERIRQIEAKAMSKLRHPTNDTGGHDLLDW